MAVGLDRAGMHLMGGHVINGWSQSIGLHSNGALFRGGAGIFSPPVGRDIAVAGGS